MKLGQENDWILSDVDLNLCVQMLGQQKYCDFPITASSQPLEQRMLECFLRLTELGLVCPQGDGFACSEEMRRRFGPVANPDRVIGISLPRQQTNCFAYQQGHYCTAVEKQGPESFGYRVLPIRTDRLKETLRTFAASVAENQTQQRSMPVPERFFLLTPEAMLSEAVLFCTVRDRASGVEQAWWVIQVEGAHWLLTSEKERKMTAYTWEALAEGLFREA